MLDALIYHPRRKHCKNPFGAVPLGTQVRFSAGLPAAAVGCTLCAAAEFSGAETETDLPFDAQGRCSGILHRSGRAGFGVVFPALSLC